MFSAISKIPIDTMPGGIIFHEPKNSIHNPSSIPNQSKILQLD
jgi:hypothetical protein